MTNGKRRTKRAASAVVQKNIRWVFFDLDGTLADSLQMMAQVYECFLGRFGHKGSKKEFKELNGPSLGEIVAILRERYKLTMSRGALLKMYREDVVRVYQKNVMPFDASEKVLRRLVRHGYRLALVTSSLRKIAKKFIDKHGWEIYFSEYIFGDGIKKAKPDPMIYQKALSKINVLPSAVVVVEDSPNGVKAARSAGLFVVGVSWDRPPRELLTSGANVVVDDLSAVMEALI